MIEIREASLADFGKIWPIFKSVIEKGDAFAYPPDMTREEAELEWFAPSHAVYVALADETLAGSYILRPSVRGRGSHVANASYMVAPDQRGKGIGRTMGEHSLKEAKRLGYSAMQFNLVVSTNTAAVELWKQLGFKIAGTLPQAFRHRDLGDVDAYVMHRFLE